MIAISLSGAIAISHRWKRVGDMDWDIKPLRLPIAIIASAGFHRENSTKGRSKQLRPPIAISRQRGGRCDRRRKHLVGRQLMLLEEGLLDRGMILVIREGFLEIGGWFLCLGKGF